MNEGLLDGITHAAPAPIEAVYVSHVPTSGYVAQTYAGYLLGTEPASDTQVMLDDAANPQELVFSVTGSRTAVVRGVYRYAKGTTGTPVLRIALYDNGTKVWPATALSSDGWYGFQPFSDGQAESGFVAVLTLASGAHRLDVRHQAAFDTSATRFLGRTLSAWVLAP